MGKRPLRAQVKDLACCGLKEWTGLRFNESTADYHPLRTMDDIKRVIPMRAVIATTVRGQGRQAKTLKRLKFKKVGTWRNGNTGRLVTLWFYNPGKKRIPYRDPEW